MSKTIYICHYCVEYKTPSKMDMKKHFNKKKECHCMNLLSYEKAKLLTLSKKFIFTFDYSQLLKDDFLYIIKNFNCYENRIDENFYKLKPVKNDFLDSILKNKEEKEDNLELVTNIICNNELTEDEKFKKMYYNEEKDKYICDKCMKEYTTKRNLLNHMKNKKSCNLQIEIKQIMEESLKIVEIKRKREEEENKKFIPHIVNGNIQNNVNNNVQNVQNNIQNINNNNNNTHHNTYNLAIKDFVHDNYDITHIKDTFYHQKDFFIYPNFLRMIMENKKNQNIFFANNEAIIYSDNELNKMSSDKAGYLVLEKLSTSFGQLMNKQDDDVREYFAFITKYYSVLKGQYKHDTIFKDYDVDERRFCYTANSGMFRSRDKYLAKIVSTVNQHSNDIRQNLNIKGDDIKDIPLINPSIEDFASARMRYRDLKDK
jgi:hypothetical protein